MPPSRFVTPDRKHGQLGKSVKGLFNPVMRALIHLHRIKRRIEKPTDDSSLVISVPDCCRDRVQLSNALSAICLREEPEKLEASHARAFPHVIS